MIKQKHLTAFRRIKNLTSTISALQLFVLLFSILPLSIILSSCGNSACGGPGYDEPDYYTKIHLLDSTNRFIEIKYLEFNDPHQVGDRYLGPSGFHWNLRISKPQTTMLIRTKNNGWDTLVYSIEKKNVMYTEENECDDAGIRMEIVGPNIVSHSFDTAYIQDIKYGSSYYNQDVDRILFIK